MEITREIFDQQRRPRFGNANPERMQFAFWEWMVRAALGARTDGADEDDGVVMRDGMLQSTHGPFRARNLFNIPLNREEGPIWTFDRMGATRNQLPDGPVIYIGGEHEDFYHPDFCIYNDVVVSSANDEISIYGFPKEVFPPTDFHTTTLTERQLIIIGGLGYKNERIFGHTPVYALNQSDFHIEKIETSGEHPGWIHKHEAQIDEAGIITIRGGKIVREYQGRQSFISNIEEYTLDLSSRSWRRKTDRQWYQAKICRDDKAAFPVKPYSKAESLLPQTIPFMVVECHWRDARILIEKVEVSITVGTFDIEIVVRGRLPEDLLTRLSEEVQMNAQALMNCKCSIQVL